MSLGKGRSGGVDIRDLGTYSDGRTDRGVPSWEMGSLHDYKVRTRKGEVVRRSRTGDRCDEVDGEERVRCRDGSGSRGR